MKAVFIYCFGEFSMSSTFQLYVYEDKKNNMRLCRILFFFFLLAEKIENLVKYLVCITFLIVDTKRTIFMSF